MSKLAMFSLGALGGVLPILVSLVTIDLAPIVDNASSLTVGNYVGYGVRVVALILLGGTFALLNKEVQQPLTLVQLGIAAPALITSYINAGVPAGSSAPLKAHATFAIIAPVHAQEVSPIPGQIRIAGFLSDVVRGAIVRTDQLEDINRRTQSKDPKATNPRVPDPTPRTNSSRQKNQN